LKNLCIFPAEAAVVSDPEAKKTELIEELLTKVRRRAQDDVVVQLECFVRQYYAHVAPEDLLERSPLDLYGAALAHWHLARQRSPGRNNIRVYNPRPEEHGWQTSHTIVELVVDDMPFLVDSVSMELNRHGLTIHLVIHPVMRVERTDGTLTSVLAPEDVAEHALTEAVIHAELDRQTEPEVLESLRTDLERVLRDVRMAVEDWQSMRARVHELLSELQSRPPGLEGEDVEEAKAFLQWMDGDYFTFLGCRDHQLVREDQGDVLRPIAGSGLGILRDEPGERVSRSFAELPPEMRRLARTRRLLILTKAGSRATVHRPGYIDYVGVRRFDAEGEVVGERRFLGLYTSGAYSLDPQGIPVLRVKVRNIMRRSGLPPRSHAGKALLNILQTFPRDELFHSSEDALFETAMGILHLQERQRVRLFVLPAPYGSFISCLVYVPRERYNTDLRERIQAILVQAFNALSIDFTVRLSESVLARIYFLVRTQPDATPQYEVHEIEQRLVRAMRSWRDDLCDGLIEHFGEERGTRLFRRYRDAFPFGYRDEYAARIAAFDIEKMEWLPDGTAIAMSLYRPLEAPPGILRFKLFQQGGPIPLSTALPMLENMGVTVLHERPYDVKPQGGPAIWVHDFALHYDASQTLEAGEVKEIFQDAFAKVWSQEAENDGFNRLVLGAQLTWREIVILRAYCKYLRQTGIAFSQSYMEDTLARNTGIARMMVQLFHARFDPATQKHTAARTTALAARLQESLEGVSNLDEDRILRRFVAVVRATTRTNYYQHEPDGQPKAYLSFKFDPSVIPDLPRPRPMFEIFVYSPKVEGVHLRGGRVARGGIRWSDRREDFRTEILGLIKAQMVKNAIIVPVGAKGGFVVKRTAQDGDRAALWRDVTAAYRTYICGLLDITDNCLGTEVMPPPSVVRHDESDPYLVVAADKGTATLSDTANQLAAERGYWLGDAFASGGSAGYDHKKMGITARGAWESVKRHFREAGIDDAGADFNVIGIGDMSGDVFGNGMLLSRRIKLVAAFNHRHIFIDPSPDPEVSYRERERLFRLPSSTWADYDPALISPGGGVYARSAKAIRLSAEARHVLGTSAEILTPAELVRVLLRAPVDLLWNGGIGTYVKASDETHAEVDDRSNDASRVSASELRCRVVAEGGNLGFTQRARIEYALAGGRINTDFIDNAGGVACSDLEVNIKILLNQVEVNGDLTRKQRDQLLAEMTEEVASRVLLGNYRQVQALSVSETQASAALGQYVRLIRTLERGGRLDRALEHLPDEEQFTERLGSGMGLVRPELAVVLSHAKLALYAELLASDLLEEPYLAGELEEYFPRPLRGRFRAQMHQHQLRREIIATRITNGIVDRMGSTFVHRLHEETGVEAAEVARSYAAAQDVFAIPELWHAIEALDRQVAAPVQITLFVACQQLLERATLWFLRNRRAPLNIAGAVRQFEPSVSALGEALPELLIAGDLEALNDRIDTYVAADVPAPIARRVASLDTLVAVLDVVEVAEECGWTPETAAPVYFSLGGRLELGWLADQIATLPANSHWQTLARAALRDDLYNQHRALTANVLKGGTADQPPSVLIDAWMAQNRASVERALQILSELRAAGAPELAMLSVALRELRSPTQSAPPAPTAQEEARRAGGE
jgi:glutamate dehydrogenase